MIDRLIVVDLKTFCWFCSAVQYAWIGWCAYLLCVCRCSLLARGGERIEDEVDVLF